MNHDLRPRSASSTPSTRPDTNTGAASDPPLSASEESGSSADALARTRVGLSAAEALTRLQTAGPNEIKASSGTPAWKIFLSQFKGAMIWLLLGACVLSALLGEVIDAIAIGTIVVLNSLVGFFQEYRAEKAVQALRSMTAPRARVMRDGHALLLAAREVVPGDVLILEAGDIVAADARLLEANLLSLNEAPLTGESAPVLKNVMPVAADAPLAERTNQIFYGTSVTTGTGFAEVIATGMQTELGKIAQLLEGADGGETPLQKRLEAVARTLMVLCLSIIVVVMILGLWRGLPWLDMLMTSISLAVAAVPEGLATVVTIALALGVQRMARRNVLIRRLPAVETLGCATVICTDKTGTLTTGIMTVRELWSQDEQALLFAAAACCDAELLPDGTGTGDTTEVALLAAAHARGIERGTLESTLPRKKVTPFDSDRKFMSIQREDGVLYVKGAFDVLMGRCSSGLTGPGETAQAANHRLAGKGLRVLAIATGSGEHEEGLTLLGLVGLADPPRPEAIEAVRLAREAGILTVMITGDHPVTANAIATELGIQGPHVGERTVVHARVTAEEKLTIVHKWKEANAVVAMTGDGVNDAPALREAHIGIAMGLNGTEVTREASDMILTDDNFASIIAAVEEGRGIYDNIQKTLVYLLTGNTGELAIMLGSTVLGLPLPLLPLQLLWINLVTDGMPALALVSDPVEKGVLSRPPRHPDEAMLGRAQWLYILMAGLMEAGVALGSYGWALQHLSLAGARTMAFSTIVFCELFRAFAARSRTQLLWQVGAFSNPRLILVVAVSAVLQVLLVTIPALRTLFGLELLSWELQLLTLGLGLIPVTLLELLKVARRAFGRTKPGAAT